MWPVFAQDRNDAYGYGQVQVRDIPNAAAISRAEKVQVWLNAIIDEDRARQIVWARAVCDAGKGLFCRLVPEKLNSPQVGLPANQPDP